jgi:formyltetrahydrofolate deformylase
MAMVEAEPTWVLTFTCTDRVGIVAGVSGFLADHDGFIVDSQQFADLQQRRFFMRVAFKAGGQRLPTSTADIRAAFATVADRLELEWSLGAAEERPSIVLAVSKTSHCLADLLHRQRSGILPVEIAAVVSNHDDLRSLVEWHGVPWRHLPITPGTRAAQEEAIIATVDEMQADYLVLARYMQILSPSTVERLQGRCINIHHSFLPGFKGARPYHQANDRGVKLIGATAHFVTADLDEGPIIEQSVERVDHRARVEDLIRIGRDVESQVLARAVTWLGERRVFLNGDRTVIFN